MIIIVGKGIFHAANVEKLPNDGDEFNFKSKMLREGVYRLKPAENMMWGSIEYPHYHIERLSDIPAGEQVTHLAPLNC